MSASQAAASPSRPIRREQVLLGGLLVAVAAVCWWITGRRMDTEVRLRLGCALVRFWVVRGHRSEGRTILERALAGNKGVATPVRAKALITAARLAFSQSDYERGESLAREGLALFRELGDIRGTALALDRLGMAAWRRGDAGPS